MSPVPLTNLEKVLAVALWKLHGAAPLEVTLADMEACRRAFEPERWMLLDLDTPAGVELRMTTESDARTRREHRDSMTGDA